ncbi:MAG: ABC transporter substrate-binding protein [Candidatus Acetothermia bacterium]|jgi:alpha-glucoside transport system substrate-binding protein|nr:ABC transporter substrate-binding protein [Candidatus Acetothermia bacterium]
MSKRVLSISFAVLLGVGLLAAFGGAQQRSVTIMVLWSGTELQAFEETLVPFEQRTGIDVQVESVGRDLPTILVTRFEAGNPPDVAALPNPGQMKEFVAEGGLVPLNFLDLSDHPTAFVDLGSVGGNVYGIFISADLKSLVWYNKKGFDANGYRAPATLDELLHLQEEIYADGITPWCIGLESGAASGWPGTDWLEDLALRILGAEVYDMWVAHDIPWNSDSVGLIWKYWRRFWEPEYLVYGGTRGMLSTNFGDSPAAMFTDPPGCLLHRQATFIQSFILGAYPKLEAGVDYDIFVFPPLVPGPAPLLGAGDLISAFKDTPEVRELMQYLASAEAQAIWVGKLGKLAINTKVAPAVYPDDITRKAAQILGSAKVFRFDGSDLMPAAVGSGAFWEGVLDYVSGVSLDTVLANIEAAAVAAYGK